MVYDSLHCGYSVGFGAHWFWGKSRKEANCTRYNCFVNWLGLLCLECSANKQFKRDSARVAFSQCVYFGGEVLCGDLVIACFTP
ncbi:hypothetical protein CGI88_24770 [Vibrio parahaemolyticus]|nr:hypothetical protein CGI88_24770 [Vibrio parahaemolyticus]TOI27409.1 hypothetical protein CGI62_24035 [Vibrio parahaemolyticus]